jgi:uncharacterized protein
MRVWVDLANSPHVPLFQPVVAAARARGLEVLLTARDHAQTLPLAEAVWPEVVAVGGASPAGRAAKGRAVVARAAALRRFARQAGVDVALSHGSYAQVVAARAARVPAVTMMDYEHQPANHVSFRLARRVIVPAAFPEAAVRRFGARRKVVRYAGYKEELYLPGTEPDATMLTGLGLDPDGVTVVMRPPPEGALYHRGGNARFDDVLAHVLERGAQVVLLPRGRAQAERYRRTRVLIPARPLDGRVLLASADLTVGAGGTMTRESALLGTPTYTVFLAALGAVDADLIREGRIVDLRRGGYPRVERKRQAAPSLDPARAAAIVDTVLTTVAAAAGSR